MLLSNIDAKVIPFYQLNNECYAAIYNLKNGLEKQYQFSLPEGRVLFNGIGFVGDDNFIYRGASGGNEYIGCIDMANYQTVWETVLPSPALSVWFDGHENGIYACTKEGVLDIFPTGNPRWIVEFTGDFDVSLKENDVVNLMFRNDEIYLMINDRIKIFSFRQ